MLLSISTLSAALLAFAQVAAAAPPKSTGPSSAPRTATVTANVRKEWRALTKTEQTAYIAAIECMQSTPGVTSDTYSGVQSKYDDWTALHIAMTSQIHFVGQFLPYHRHLLSLFEQDLQTTCSYEGSLTYWDWSLDTVEEADFLNSPVFDATYGFGGTGANITADEKAALFVTSDLVIPGVSLTGGGCVETGFMAGKNVSMGPGDSLTYTPHCLRRDVSPSYATEHLNATAVSWSLQAPDFWEFDRRIESIALTLDGVGPHGGAHFAIGGMVGEMSDTWSSPGDPLFWLHHTMLDNIWNQWQQADFAARKVDINGPDTMWAYPYNYFGDIPYANVTLDFVLAYGVEGASLGANVTIGQVMDISAGTVSNYSYETASFF